MNRKSGKQATIIVVFGKRGEGKTCKVRELIKNKERLIVVDTLGEYELPIQIEFSLDKLVRQLKKTPYRFQIAYRYIEEEIDKLFEILYCVEDYTLVLEEVDNYTSPGYAPLGLRKIIRYGRHKGIEIIATSRRPAEVCRLLTSQADYIFWFKFSEPVDIDYVRKTHGREISETVRNLEHHQNIMLEL